tara:strand:- start:126689 stop:127156 length:468 start_codon:yes stop_codon:yes gene_type:complete
MSDYRDLIYKTHLEHEVLRKKRLENSQDKNKQVDKYGKMMMIWRFNFFKKKPMTEKIQEYLKKYDLNSDGTITDEEIERTTKILELELREEKAEAQKRMSWISIISMVLFTIVLFTPILKDSRVSALADLLGLFYLAQASIVGFYFGAQAYMSRK